MPEQIQHALNDIRNRLSRMERREYDGQVLRRLTAIERLISGGDMHIAPRHTRRRPLGIERAPRAP